MLFLMSWSHNSSCHGQANPTAQGTDHVKSSHHPSQDVAFGSIMALPILRQSCMKKDGTSPRTARWPFAFCLPQCAGGIRVCSRKRQSLDERNQVRGQAEGGESDSTKLGHLADGGGGQTTLTNLTVTIPASAKAS